jgi:hypothetical protein
MSSATAAQLKAMSTISGGEVIDLNAIKAK